VGNAGRARAWRRKTAHLEGLKDYLNTRYEISVFDTALKTENLWEFHRHEDFNLRARVTENRKWDLTLATDAGQEEIQKIWVTFLCSSRTEGEDLDLLERVDGFERNQWCVADLIENVPVFFFHAMFFRGQICLKRYGIQ
jgi:hypothetical protein